MNRIAAILIVGSLIPTASFGYQPDVTQERMEYVPEDADHLEPSGSRMPEEPPLYYIAIFGRYPSFSPAFEWCLFKSKQSKGTYLLSSWRLERLNRTDEKPTGLEKREVEVSEQIAALIYEMWANEILDARYSRNGGGLDGTSYRFSTYLRGVGWPGATTWSPEREAPPIWMVDAGEGVLSYARGEFSDAGQLFARLKDANERLKAYHRTSSASANRAGSQ